MSKFSEITNIMSDSINHIITKIPESVKADINEIRLRSKNPLCIRLSNSDYFVLSNGTPVNTPANAYITTKKDIAETLTLISEYSIYAFEEEIKKGFITIKGGHRVGLCGKAVIEHDKVKTIKHISSLNIRVSHEVKGAANSVIKSIINNGKINNTIIVSPPGAGKTTLLRDIIRQLSNGIDAFNFNGVTVAVVDERSEIAGTYMGEAQNDIGVRTDVIDGCPKSIGMKMLLRGMAPICIAVDEIGGKEDITAINEISSAGVKVICTIHGNSINDLKRNPHLAELLHNQIFDIAIEIQNNKSVRTINILKAEQIN